MTYKIERILVPVDFSDTSEMAIATGAAMARHFKAELTLLHVVEYKEYYFSVLPEAKLLMPRIETIKIEAKKKLDEMQSTIKVDSGVRPHVITTSGNIESEIRDYASKEKMDLIIMGTHGISGYKEIFIGSNAQRVVTLSDIPVLTITKDCSAGFHNILMPFDDSLYSRYKVNIAGAVAEAYNAHVHILGILDSDDKDDMRKMKIKIHQVEGVISGKNLQFTTEIKVARNMAKTAMAYATENNCDLMVINTGHESEITGIFLGAFAQQIVNHSTVPVLSVKPLEGSYAGGTAGSGV
jgi:nucleotide-binding universal stress UspA family protein